MDFILTEKRNTMLRDKIAQTNFRMLTMFPPPPPWLPSGGSHLRVCCQQYRLAKCGWTGHSHHYLPHHQYRRAIWAVSLRNQEPWTGMGLSPVDWAFRLWYLGIYVNQSLRPQIAILDSIMCLDEKSRMWHCTNESHMSIPSHPPKWIINGTNWKWIGFMWTRFLLVLFKYIAA